MEAAAGTDRRPDAADPRLRDRVRVMGVGTRKK
jgi:hypothetical protein